MKHYFALIFALLFLVSVLYLASIGIGALSALLVDGWSKGFDAVRWISL